MAGVRRHSEMSAVMLKDHLHQIKQIIPELADLLNVPANRAAFYKGTIWADWTHVANNLKQFGAYLPAHSPSLLEILLPDWSIDWHTSIIQHLKEIAQKIDLKAGDKELEHYAPGLHRYVAYLRSYAAQVNGDDEQRVAFLLGLVSHMYQDIVFHFDGQEGYKESNFIDAFADKTGLTQDERHGTTELDLDFYDWQTSPLDEEVIKQKDFQIGPLLNDFNVIYDLLLGISIPQEEWDIVGQLVELIQWKALRTLAQGTGFLVQSAVERVRSQGNFAHDYFRGGLVNGASATQMGVLRWFAQIKGWYLYQNEVHATYLEDPTPTDGRAYVINGKWESKYLPYLGATDATIDKSNPTFNTGLEPFLDLSPSGKRVLIRFEIKDIHRFQDPSIINDLDGRNRSIWGNITVAEAKLWLCFAKRQGVQTTSRTLQVYKVNSAWNEGRQSTNRNTGEIGNQAEMGEVCYAAAQYNLLNWKEAGCQGVPQDRDQKPIDTIELAPSLVGPSWISLNVTSAVQYWIDHPGQNYGLLLCLAEEVDGKSTDSDILQFYSSQANQSDVSPLGIGDRVAFHPLLIVKPEGTWMHDIHGDPELSDLGHWDRPEYYQTIRSQVVHRDGRDELFLLARGVNGIDTWHLDFHQKRWEPLAHDEPFFTDNGGWNQEQYYSTIQTQAMQRNGQGEFLLVARAQAGIVTYRFNFSTNRWEQLGSWGDLPLNDNSGWNQKQHYSTIQTQIVRRDGQDNLLLIARAQAGIITYRFNFFTNHWEQLSPWGDPPLNDESGWSQEQHYATIQTQVVQRNDQDDLWMIARAQAGIVTYRFNFSTNRWEQLGSWGDPPLNDNSGWNQKQHYTTIQTASLHRNNSTEGVLLLLARGPKALEVFEWENGRWVASNQELAWGNQSGWSEEKYYATIRTLAVGLSGRNQELLLFARRSGGIDTYRYDAATHLWQQMTTANPPWIDTQEERGWHTPDRYRTIRTAALHRDGEDIVLLLARGSAGIQVSQFHFGPSSRWVGR